MKRLYIQHRTTFESEHKIIHPYPFRELKIKLDINSPSQQYMYRSYLLDEPYEKETIDILTKYLTKEDIFIDIGAHIGYFTILGAYLADKVYSFEPDTDNYTHLIENCVLNKLPNVKINQSVVSDRNGKATFYTNIDNDGGHALWNPGLHEFNYLCREKQLVKTITQGTLDTFISFLNIVKNKVKVIKMDTEGAEVLILRGMKDILQSEYLKLVVCEYNLFGMHRLRTDGDEMFNIMTFNGFKPYDENMKLITPENSKDRERTENIFFIRG